MKSLKTLFIGGTHDGKEIEVGTIEGRPYHSSMALCPLRESKGQRQEVYYLHDFYIDNEHRWAYVNQKDLPRLCAWAKQNIIDRVRNFYSPIQDKELS